MGEVQLRRVPVLDEHAHHLVGIVPSAACDKTLGWRGPRACRNFLAIKAGSPALRH
jgi:hypothetical protein